MLDYELHSGGSFSLSLDNQYKITGLVSKGGGKMFTYQCCISAGTFTSLRFRLCYSNVLLSDEVEILN